MLKVGLTGGIGSGKSIVGRIFELLGIPVYYADDAARRLMQTNEQIRESIIALFGNEAYKNETLNSAYIGSIVFSDHKKLEQLNALTHPATIQDAAEWMNRQKSPYVVKEAALLFESGAEKDLHTVIGVDAPRALRISRVMTRDGITEAEVLQRIERQMDDLEKMSRCDYIITNDEQELVVPQVLSLHKIFLKGNVRYRQEAKSGSL